MKHAAQWAGILLLLAGTAFSQGLDEKEPSRKQLGAPLYPGAVYIRIFRSLDPYHESAEYITADDLDTVIAYFERTLPENRLAIYEDKNSYIAAFLLKTWSKIPETLGKEDLPLLEKEPNLQVRSYDPVQYGTLIDFYARRPEGKVKAGALDNGQTMIKYTYRISEESASVKMIVGSWRETDRDLPRYYGSVIRFRADKTYTFTYTCDNLLAMDKTGAVYVETGKYSLMNNMISMKSDNPLDGDGKWTGFATVGNASLSLEIDGRPRMTFLRVK